MNNRLNPQHLVDLVRDKVVLYQNFLSHQQGRIELLLKGTAQQIEEASRLDEKLLQDIREGNRRLTRVLEGKTLNQVIRQIEQPMRQDLKALLKELQYVLALLSRVNFRNYRFIQTSFSYNQSMLQEVFEDSSRYDGNGFIQAGTGDRPRKGVVL